MDIELDTQKVYDELGEIGIGPKAIDWLEKKTHDGKTMGSEVFSIGLSPFSERYLQLNFVLSPKPIKQPL